MKIDSALHQSKTTELEAISFIDSTCPHCGKALEVFQKPIKNYKVNMKYVCKSCGFECPIYHDNDTICPTYDSTVSDFLKSFGKL